MKKSFSCLLLFAAAFSSLCIAADGKIDPNWPTWLKDAMKKEYQGISWSEVAVGQSKTLMPGTLTAREVVDDNTIYAVTNDGSGTSFECWFFEDARDVSQSLHNISELVISNMAKENGAVSGRQVFEIDAGVIDGAPYLSLEWLLAMGSAPNATVGLSKVRAAEKNGKFVACSHAMVGYRQSFAQAFEWIVSNLEAPPGYKQPYYSQVHVATLAGLGNGFVQLSFVKDKDGNTEIRVTDSMLLQFSADTVQTADSTSRSWSTPDGYLINSQYGAAENGELIADLSLSNTRESGWQVTGSLNGAPVSAEVEGPVPPHSSLGEMMVVRDLLKDPRKEFASVTVWLPSNDPEVFTDVPMTRQAGADSPGQLKLNIGGTEMLGEYDAYGTTREVSVDFGIATMRLRRVYSSGQPYN